MTFLIKCKAKGWKAIFSAMNSLNEEASLQVASDGVHFYCLDASKNSQLEWDWTQNIDVAIDEPKQIGFRISELRKVFLRMDDEDDIVLQDEEGYLKISCGKKQFLPRLIELTFTQERRHVKVNPETLLEITAEELSKITHDATIFDDQLIFDVHDEHLFLRVKDAAGAYNIDMGNGYAGTFKVKFSIDYFMKVIDPISKYIENLKIYFGRESEDRAFPAKFMMEIKDMGIITYWMGPIEPVE